jgi:predicted Zn-dependent peptidase
MALGAGSDAEFPGGKYPSLFLFYVAPSTGHSAEENQKEIDQIIQQVKTTKVDEETLQRVKTKLRAELIRKLGSNAGLASELCSYYVNYGDWRTLFTELDDYNKVTAADVQRVANTYLVKEHRTVAYTYVPGEDSQKEGAK